MNRYLRNLAFLITGLFALGWFGAPYLTRATEKGRIFSDDSSDLTSNNPNDGLRQIRGVEGYWRLVQDNSGAWWFDSPSGHREFLNTVTTVQPVQFGLRPDDAHFVSHDATGSADNLDRWAASTLARVHNVGFKGLGAWCNPAFHQLDIPMSQDLNLWTWVKDDSKRFYSPNWEPQAEQAARAQILPLRENRNLIGYYIDNELDWGDGFAGPGVYFNDLPSADPNRQQVLDVVHAIWHTVGDFNKAWGTRFTDWSQVNQMPELPRDDGAYTLLSSVWLSHLAEDYFRTTTSIIHQYDPNHLILGVRFKGYAPEEVVAASRGYTDAQSINYYVGDAMLDPRMFSMMYQRAGQPIIISEYSFHSLDGHSGDRDVVGFNAQVPDQQARADGYRLMTTHLARVPYIVGADWFQWCDEPPGGRSPDGEDVNFGVVDIHDKPYQLLADAVRTATPLLNPLHAASVGDAQKDVWRDTYSDMPAMHVPYLTTAPALDADFSAWTTGGMARLPDVRRDQTVGLDRRPVNTPGVYIGWNLQGIYLAMEVFDDHLEAAAPTGWWWTRDHVEFWISTQPNGQSVYDNNCHQFFFVPTVTNGQTGGVVGQWHRDGDSLADNLIPDADIKPTVKVLADRYLVQMLIPAKTLHGFDPQHHRALSFNMHVRDFQSAADFFWSAPKAMQTQLRPDTWGTLILDSPTTPAIADATAK